MIPITKRIADVITWARVLLFPLLVWLGFSRGLDAFPIIVIIMLLNLTFDSIDGPLARYRPSPRQSWIGERDLDVDMFVTSGLLAYLTISGVIPLPVTLLYLLIWAIYFWYNGIPHSMGVLYEIPIYICFLVIAVTEAPILLLILVIVLLIALIVSWPKFPKESLPEFFSGVLPLWKKRSERSQ